MPGKSYRDRYFEEYTAKSAEVGGKKKVTYKYVGYWYSWGTEGFSLRHQKRLYAAVELLSIALYLAAGLQQTPVNSVRLAAGLGILSVIPWLLELWSVIRFLLSREYLTSIDYNEINTRLRLGALSRSVLLVLSLLCAVAGSGMAALSSTAAALALLGVLLSAGCSLLIWWKQKKIGYRIYRNINGQAGEEC